MGRVALLVCDATFPSLLAAAKVFSSIRFLMLHVAH